MNENPVVTDQAKINDLLLASTYVCEGYASPETLTKALASLPPRGMDVWILWSFRINMGTKVQEAVGFEESSPYDYALGEKAAVEYAKEAHGWTNRREKAPYVYLAWCACSLLDADPFLE